MKKEETCLFLSINENTGRFRLSSEEPTLEKGEVLYSISNKFTAGDILRLWQSGSHRKAMKLS